MLIAAWNWNFQCLFQCLFRFGGSYTRISPLFWSRRRQSTCIRPQVDFPSLSFSTIEPPPDPSGGERANTSKQQQGATDAGGYGRERQHHSRGTYLGARDRPRARRAEAGDTHARTRRRCLRTWSRRDQVEREGLRWRGALGGKGATGWPSFLFSGRSHLVLFQPPVPLPCPNVALRWP